jgi:hypothetical protein
VISCTSTENRRTTSLQVDAPPWTRWSVAGSAPLITSSRNLAFCCSVKTGGGHDCDEILSHPHQRLVVMYHSRSKTPGRRLVFRRAPRVGAHRHQLAGRRRGVARGAGCRDGPKMSRPAAQILLRARKTSRQSRSRSLRVPTLTFLRVTLARMSFSEPFVCSGVRGWASTLSNSTFFACSRLSRRSSVTESVRRRKIRSNHAP